MATSAEQLAAGYRLQRPEDLDLERQPGRVLRGSSPPSDPDARSARRHGVRDREGRPRRLLRRADAKDGPARDPEHRGLSLDCEIPEDRRLGEEGKGFYSLMHTFDESRIHLAASAVGIGRAALEYAVEYAKRPGKRSASPSAPPGGRFPARRHGHAGGRRPAADPPRARSMDAGRHAAGRGGDGQAVCLGDRFLLTWAALQTLGGWGYSREYPVEKWVRDARLRRSRKAPRTFSG